MQLKKHTYNFIHTYTHPLGLIGKLNGRILKPAERHGTLLSLISIV